MFEKLKGYTSFELGRIASASEFIADSYRHESMAMHAAAYHDAKRETARRLRASIAAYRATLNR